MVIEQPLAEWNSRYLVSVSPGKINLELFFVTDIVYIVHWVKGKYSSISRVFDAFECKIYTSLLSPCKSVSSPHISSADV